MAKLTPLAASAALALLALGSACARQGLNARAVAGALQPAAVPTLQPTPAPSFPQNRPVDESRPVKVRSARLRHDQQAQLTVFYGGVTVTHDTSTLTAQELRSADQGATAEALGGVRVSDTQRQFTAEAGRLRYANDMQEGSLEDGVQLVTLGPYGRGITVTGQRGGYHGLSRSAWVEGGVQALQGALSVTAQRAEIGDNGAVVRLQGGVDALLGANHAQSQEAELRREGQSLELSGTVKARFTPRQLREAAERPWGAETIGPEEAK